MKKTPETGFLRQIFAENESDRFDPGFWVFLNLLNIY
jgi:hypothetical protein